MNYRHAFHAGNHADVLKHITLLVLVDALLQKPTDVFALDTHAGRGSYSLSSANAQATMEAEGGVSRLMAEAPNDPVVQRYLQAVKAHRAESGDRTSYPGSPWFLMHALREGDRMAFVELNPEEADVLKQTVGRDDRVQVRVGDGYGLMKSFLPPRKGSAKINRGLILIDPPYEAQLGEFDEIIGAVRDALERWPLGIFAIWYPIKLRRSLQPFYRRVASLPVKNALRVEMLVRPDNSPLRMNGSGMMILNAPWQVDAALKETLRKVLPLIQEDKGAEASVDWVIAPK